MGVPELKQKAKDAFRRKHYELAVEVYLEALRFEANDRELVEGFFQAARRLRETKGKALFGGMLGKVSVKGTRDPRKRMTACFRALARNPESKSLLARLGEAAGQTGAEEAAVAAYRLATEVDPDDAAAWKYLGTFLGRLGRVKEALEALGESVRLDPRDQEAAKLRKNLAAERALQAGRYNEAGSSRELMKDQDEARQLEKSTRIQLTPEHAAQEVEEIRTHLAKEPGNARLHLRLGEMLLQTGDEEGALEAFEEAVRCDPLNHDLTVRVGDMRLRRLQGMARAAKEAHEAHPDDPELEAKRDETMKAFLQAQRDEYSRRVKEHPMDLKERFRLGRTLLALGKYDAAAAEFQQTVRDPQRKTESLRYLAQCFEKKGLTSLALKKLEEAMADFPSPTSPQAKDVHYAYGDLLERAGERDRARQVFEGIFEVDIMFRDVSKRLETLTKAPG
ncbi:MAG: tetratricopeptide repeat protein [Planctomycetota bacterium]